MTQKVLLPAQFASREEGEAVDSAAGAAGGGTKCCTSALFILNLILLISLNQLWGAINGL